MWGYEVSENAVERAYLQGTYRSPVEARLLSIALDVCRARTVAFRVALEVALLIALVIMKCNVL